MNTIAKMHAHWAATILPKDAPQVQRQEMERSFYSGFYSALVWQATGLALLPDDQAVAELEARHKEAEAYFKTLAQAPKEIERS
jgi:hypothetical protein